MCIKTVSSERKRGGGRKKIKIAIKYIKKGIFVIDTLPACVHQTATGNSDVDPNHSLK